MAIYKYTPDSPVVDLTEAAAFINEYKSGTFLGSATISGDSTSLTITLGTATFEMKCAIGINESNPIVYSAIKSGSTVKQSYSYVYNQTNYNGYIKLKAFYFCKNGVIFQMNWNDSGNSKLGAICALTIDEAGNLVLLNVDSTQLTENSGVFSGFKICAINSYLITVNTDVVTTDYLTALAGLAVAFPGNIIKKCDNAFFAYESQSASSDYTGLYTLSLNQVSYISNGVWYFKDE